MGVFILRNKVKKVEFDISVINIVINNLLSDVDIVIIYKDLIDCVKVKLLNVMYILVDNFLNSLKYDEFIENLKK